MQTSPSLRRNVARATLLVGIAAAVVGPVTAAGAAADPAPGTSRQVTATPRMQPLTTPVPKPSVVLNPEIVSCTIHTVCDAATTGPTVAPADPTDASDPAADPATDPATDPADTDAPTAAASPSPATGGGTDTGGGSGPGGDSGTDSGTDAGTDAGTGPGRISGTAGDGTADAGPTDTVTDRDPAADAGGTAGGGAETTGTLAGSAPADERLPLPLVAGLTLLGAVTTGAIVLAVRRRGAPAAW